MSFVHIKIFKLNSSDKSQVWFRNLDYCGKSYISARLVEQSLKKSIHKCYTFNLYIDLIYSTEKRTVLEENLEKGNMAMRVLKNKKRDRWTQKLAEIFQVQILLLLRHFS